MALLKVAKLGKSVLRKIARPVTESEFHTPEFQQFLDNLVETMRHLKAVGMAAPQVYRSKRVIVLESPGNPLLILLNPKITFFSEEGDEALEGCVSLDNLRGKVFRSSRVKVVCFDREMKPVELDAAGYFARVLQHEIDHLDGKVFTDRMTDLTSLSLRSSPIQSTKTTPPENGKRSLTFSLEEGVEAGARPVSKGRPTPAESITSTYHWPVQAPQDQTFIESDKGTSIYTL
jgi:peptide deformylase